MNRSTIITPKLYIGLDIHKRSWKIQLATDIGMGKSWSMEPDTEGLRNRIYKYYEGYEIHIAYESGCCGFEPHRSFEKYGWKSIVFNPADITRIGTSQYQKTDSIDARLICRELKDGRLRSIGIPDRKREELRALFRYRNNLVKDLRRVKSRLKMQLLYLGLKAPEGIESPKWTHKYRNWVRSIQMLYSTGDEMLEQMMDQYDYVESSIRQVSVKLRAYCRRHYKKDYYLLRSIPGIGPIVACGILSELGDLRRFKSNKQLSAYVGLMPCIYQSGDNIRSHGITPRAQHLIRSYFIESSWQAIRVDPALQAYYRTHQGKDSKQIIIKVARKLLNRARAVIKNELPYELGMVE